MNQTINRFANLLQWAGVFLVFLAAMRADGGLGFWLTPALVGTVLAAVGLGLWWLCSDKGRAFCRRTFGEPVPAPAAPCRETVIPFPKAG